MSFFKTIVGWISSSSPAKADSPSRTGGRSGRRRGKNSFVPAEMATPPACVVAIAGFNGGNGVEASRRLGDFLADREFLKIRVLNKRLRVPANGNLVDRLADAAEKGRLWLAESDADILLWGSADSGGGGVGTSVRVRFLTRKHDTDGRPGSFGLGDELNLPLDFTKDVGGVLCAAVLAATIPTRDGPRQHPVEMLMAEVDLLAGIIKAPPSELSNDQAASVLVVIGNSCAALSRLPGDTGNLDRAVRAYRAALDRILPDKEPLVWSLTQNHLASVLEVMGEGAGDVKFLEEAVEAYQSAALTLHRITHASDWALAHVRLGMALYKVGAISGRARSFQDSVTAFETAHQVFSRAAMPGQWSEVMNHLGVAYMGLGEHVEGTKQLEQSVACFRASLEVRGREATPLLWAQTANNLGAAAFALSKRNGDTALMNEASACFEGASEVYNALGKSKLANVIDKNISRVHRLLETRSGK